MKRYAFKLAAAAIVFLIVGYLAILIRRIWQNVDRPGAAAIIVFGGLLLFTWLADRKDKAKGRLDDLPPI